MTEYLNKIACITLDLVGPLLNEMKIKWKWNNDEYETNLF